MSNHIKFTLKSNKRELEVTFNNVSSAENTTLSLSYEYLRIFSPHERQKALSARNVPSSSIPQVFHKKNIQLSTIEPVGKHGHRLIFNDGFSDIYSNNELLELSNSFNGYWAQYIGSLSNINSREESINFKAVT